MWKATSTRNVGLPPLRTVLHVLTFWLVPAGDPGSYKSPFLKDFIHLNVAMMTSNNALVPDPDKQDDLASAWWQWPILNVGLRMCGWDDHSESRAQKRRTYVLIILLVVKYFLLGNPLVYWGTIASIPFFGLVVLFYLIRWQRGYIDLNLFEIDQIHYAGIYPVIGWVLHYLPFIAMGRVTYVHHYYPALYFGILVAGFCVDFTTRKWRKDAQWAFYGLLYAALAGLFWLFRAIVFGMEGSHTQWAHLKWLESWRITD